jgi:hypothetical protein
VDTNNKTAEELADLIAERQLIANRRASEALRSKCKNAITKMVVDLAYEATVQLTQEDLTAVGEVTEELRSLNYKFRFVEIQNTEGEILEQKLVISIKHAL